MATALVTGASGFVGRHFVAHLRGQGWKVFAYDNRYADWLTERVDVRDLFCGGSVHPPCDLVVHCAAVVGGRQVIDGNPLAQAVNLELDAALFRWAMWERPGRIIYFSSSAAYSVSMQSRNSSEKLREDYLRFGIKPVGMPDQLYGWAKVTGELLASKAMEQGQAVTIVRPFSGYGEDQDDTYPFPAFIDRALRREDPFTIWGDGQQTRDFIHIDDIVAATMAIVDRDENGPVNLGTGLPTTMLTLAREVCMQADYDPEFEFSRSAPSGVEYRVADPYQMRGFYTPKIPLSVGIARALEYRKRYLAARLSGCG